MTIETFKEFIPIYEQVKWLTVEGQSLEEYLNSFVKKYHKNINNGVYVEPISDLSPWIENPDLSTKGNINYFVELLCSRIEENTLHGTHGVSEYSEIFLIHGEKYEIKIENVQWNRVDYKYYYIDNYEPPKIIITKL